MPGIQALQGGPPTGPRGLFLFHGILQPGLSSPYWALTTLVAGLIIEL